MGTGHQVVYRCDGVGCDATCTHPRGWQPEGWVRVFVNQLNHTVGDRNGTPMQEVALCPGCAAKLFDVLPREWRGATETE